MEEQEGEAGSFFGSESEPGQESQHHGEEQGAGAADSVNYGAQSPRVPRSQISRAHPGQTLGYAERTSAVLSALSGDDETALSAAEVAGEHTSHPQLTVAPPAAAPVLGAAAAAAGGGLLPGPPPQQPPLAAAALAAAAADDPLSPPESTSPMYRASSVVSHTAAPLRMPALKRPVEAPMSAPALQNALMGASPTTSRVEISHRLPFGPLSHAGRSFAPRPQPHQARSQQAPQYQHQLQHQHLQAAALPGPSYVSLSHASAHPRPASPAGPLPSTLGMALGMPQLPVYPPPPTFAPLAASSPATVASQPASQPVAASDLAAWVGLAASMGMPLDMLQAQGSAIQGGAQGGSQAPLAQQAEALQSMAAALQAQASVILQQQQLQAQAQAQQLAQQEQVVVEATGSAAPVRALPPLAHQRQGHGHGQGLARLPQPQPQNAVIEGSAGGGASIYSLPDLVGASVVQGHPLPPPFYATGAATAGGPAATAPTLISGVTPPAPLAAPSPADATPAGPQLPGPPAPAAGSNLRPGSGDNRRGSGSPTYAAATGGERDPRLQQNAVHAAAQAPASSMVDGRYRPPLAGGGAGGQQQQQQPAAAAVGSGQGQRLPSAREPAGPSPGGAVASVGAPQEGSAQGGAEGGDQYAAPRGMPSTDAAAIGGNLGGDEAANDGLEVQQAAPAAFPAPGSAPLGGAPQDTGGDARQQRRQQQQQQQQEQGQRQGDGEEGAQQLEQPRGSECLGPSPGGLPPAPHGAASVMATLVSSGEQSDVESEISGMQQAASGPHSHPAPAGEAQSALPSMQPAAATTNAHMSLSLVAATASQPPPRQAPLQQQQQPPLRGHSESGQSPPGQGAAGSRLATVETGADDDAGGGSVDMTCPAWRQPQHQPAASAPLPAVGGGAGGAAAGAVQLQQAEQQAHPAASAPMVLPGQPAEPDQPQPAISVSLSAHCEEAGGPPGHFAEHNPAAPQAQSSAFVFKRQQRTSAWEEHNAPLALPAPPAGAGVLEGEGEQQMEEALPLPPALGEGVMAEGGSPRASTFRAGPAASAGTARGTILAGQAHSILTTAAAGDGEHGEAGEEGEALSPLVLVRLPPAVPANVAGPGKYALQHHPGGDATHVATNFGTVPSPPAGGRVAPNAMASVAAAAVAPPHRPPSEPMDFSTMAQDVGGPTARDEPEQTLSGQQPTAALNHHHRQQGVQSSDGGGGGSGDGGEGRAGPTCAWAGRGGGTGAGAESVQGNGVAYAEADGPSSLPEVAKPLPGGVQGGLLNGHEVGPAGLDSAAAAAAYNYASSVILGNGFPGGAGGGAASEHTSPPSLTTSFSGKRREPSKRKRGTD